jgi:NAD(P)-dependent dehydrogenase (short-subunit alcohol dehydrogenase family)
MGRLNGKVAIVTGIGAGIGQGIAKLFVQEGAAVFGCDINPVTAEKTLALHRNGEAGWSRDGVLESLHPCDLTKPADAKKLVDAAISRFGRLDILVNAAAIPPRMASAAAMDYEADWRATIEGEVDLVFLLTKEAWPHLEKSGAASIINFASVNAYRASRNFGMLAHCAGKAAVLGMTRQLAAEGGPFNIRANTISPGLVQTAATEHAGATQEGAANKAILERLVIKRLGKPEDIGWAAVYLASDEASWVTGTDFSINGGVLAV